MARSKKKTPLTNPLETKPLERDEIDEVIDVVAKFVSPSADIERLRESLFYRPVRDRVIALVEGRKGR